MITHDVDEAVLVSDRIVMMSNGPSANIGKMLEVDLKRPRERLRLAADARYNQYRANVIDFLHERHRTTGAQVVHAADSLTKTRPAQAVSAG